MKKFFFILFILLINYLLLTAIVFTFSYLSLINGKTYDWFWVKSIQKKIYFRGYRSIWQYKNDCTSFDKNLLYKPKIGKCVFSNPEFSTELNFDEFTRNHKTSIQEYDPQDYYIVLGDSIAMGWGVNDYETFSYKLEKLVKKKVYNMGVSSYGTVREIKRLLSSPYYTNSKTIIIQYHPNDLGENINLDFNKVYNIDDYKKIFQNDDNSLSNTKYIFRNYKTSVRLFFSDIIDKLFIEKNLELIDFNEHRKYLEKIIKMNIDLSEKKVIIFLVKTPWEKVINFPKSDEKIKYILINLDKSSVFNIDEHPNKIGHSKIARILFDYFKK
tara:strand:+ start:1659 stop:2639 length:981 start_codon:yes stop_codon:yes gene_type:complete